MQPAWEPQLNDQRQYLALARGLVERGEFTHATGGERFIPETNRLPGYPLFVAPLCAGGCDRWRIAIVQGAIYALLVLATYALARRFTRHCALAAILVALYAPFAYYAALALSDVVGATLVALGVLAWTRASDTRSARWGIAAGALLGWAGLMRGALLLLPFALALLALVRDRRAARVSLACALGAIAIAAPYVAYSESAFGRVTGGNSGAVLWIGVFQGRTEESLDETERAVAAATRADIAAFDAIADRYERALAWPRLDDTLAARARELIAHDPLGWIARAGMRSLVLWAGDRGATADDESLVLLSAVAQLVITIAGLAGAVVLARRDPWVGGVALLVVAYVWLTAIPFQTEGRYSLPARAFLIIGLVETLDFRITRRA